MERETNYFCNSCVYDFVLFSPDEFDQVLPHSLLSWLSKFPLENYLLIYFQLLNNFLFGINLSLVHTYILNKILHKFMILLISLITKIHKSSALYEALA